VECVPLPELQRRQHRSAQQLVNCEVKLGDSWRPADSRHSGGSPDSLKPLLSADNSKAVHQKGSARRGMRHRAL